MSFFKEPRAHALILRVFSLPSPLLEDLFLDLITADLSIFLYRTCAGNLEGIKKFILDEKVNSYARLSAVEALLFCVVSGVADRNEVLHFLAGLFHEKQSLSNPGRGNDFLGLLVLSLLEFYPDSIADEIRSAFQRGLISEDMISRAEFEADLRESSWEQALLEAKEKLELNTPEDIHDMLFSVLPGNDNEADFFSEEEDFFDDSFFEPSTTVVHTEPKVGRNDPCACGSGQKYKKCCL